MGLTKKGKREAFDKIRFHGWDADGAVLSEHIKDILAVIFLLVVVGLIIFGFINCKINKNCTHEDFDPNDIWIDRLNKEACYICPVCDKEIRKGANVEVVEHIESTCLERGKLVETWTWDEYPDLVYTHEKELDYKICEIGEVISGRVHATCYSEGQEAIYACKWCGVEMGGNIIPIVNHYYEDYGYVAATCTTTGLTAIKKCIWCDDHIGEQEEIPMLSHNFINEINTEQTYEAGSKKVKYCDGCEQELVIEYNNEPLLSEFFEYSIDEDNNLAVLTALKKNVTELIIPGYINGYPVKEISESFFENNNTLEKVIINEGVETISKKAFKNCSALKEITFPNSLMLIDEEAFYNCDEIRRIDVEYATISTHAFSECTNLRIVNLGDDLNGIYYDSFYNCFNIIFFRFPKYVGNGRVNYFDSSLRYAGNIDALENYVSLTSGNYSFDNYKNGERSDDVIIEKDGFYYYKDTNKRYVLLSIDKSGDELITLDDLGVEIETIRGSAFRGITNESCSILIPLSVYRISYDNLVYTNISMYCEATETYYGDYREIYGDYYDEATQSTINYTCVRYYYSETEKSSSVYWHYDNEGKIVLW